MIIDCVVTANDWGGGGDGNAEGGGEEVHLCLV